MKNQSLLVVVALASLMGAAAGCAMSDGYEEGDRNLTGQFCPVYFAPTNYCSDRENLVHAYAPECRDVCVAKEALQSCGCIPSHYRWCTRRGPEPVYCLLRAADEPEPVGPQGEPMQIQAIRFICNQRGVCPGSYWRYPLAVE